MNLENKVRKLFARLDRCMTEPFYWETFSHEELGLIIDFLIRCQAEAEANGYMKKVGGLKIKCGSKTLGGMK